MSRENTLDTRLIDCIYRQKADVWMAEIKRWEDRNRRWWFPLSMIASIYWFSAIRECTRVLDEWDSALKIARNRAQDREASR